MLAAAVVTCFAGCGGHARMTTTQDAKAPWSVAEVKCVFRKHGITLTKLPLASNVSVNEVALTGLVNATMIQVAVHPTVKSNRYYATLGNDTPHGLFGRNVTAAWTGSDIPQVEAAMNELR